MTERENDVVAFTEIFEEIEETEEPVIEIEIEEEEKGEAGAIQELESLLSTFDLQGGGASPKVIRREGAAREEKKEKSVVLKQEIEDEFLLIDSLVQIYEESEGGEAEGDDLVLLKEVLDEAGEKKTGGEGEEEGEGEREKEVSEGNVCLEEGKEVVWAIQGQMERLRKMFTSEQVVPQFLVELIGMLLYCIFIKAVSHFTHFVSNYRLLFLR